jgi:hypothetical protein
LGIDLKTSGGGFVGHPGVGDGGEQVVFVASGSTASDVAVCADEPTLFDGCGATAGDWDGDAGPEGWLEGGASFVEGDGVASVIDQSAEPCVVEGVAACEE